MGSKDYSNEPKPVYKTVKN